MWFCHECQEEMQPIMVPDAHCPNCNGSFVERIDNPNDDPREFHHNHPTDGDLNGVSPDLESFLRPFPYTRTALPDQLIGGLVGLQYIMDQGARAPRSPPSEGPSEGSNSRFRFDPRPSTHSGRRISGLPNIHPPGNGDVPSMSQYRRENDMAITGPLMAQYLAALMSIRGGGLDPMMPGNQGRWGDYAFTQEALDQIMTQLMESTNASRPVPATDEVMSKLPRQVLEIGSPTLEKECAVCKDQFQLETEDPEEQIVVELPCLHSFHEGCIMPWLKSSGTCPVCRHALVPQPEHHPEPPRSTRPSHGSDPPQQTRNSQDANSLFGTLFRSGMFGGAGRGGSSSSSDRSHR